MIVATAGHIDHGKTLLVKRLTGVDTDRLPEEKARGISIDLGFAYLPLEDGGLIGFVDVPGHEKFIRNMLAGVCGIDYALLVVAADDGVMPQTVEHLQILDLLQVRRGAVVITKTDRVDAAQVESVRAGVAALLAGSALAGAPMLEVSALTGAGIGALRQLLVDESRRQTARFTEGQYFRFAVDRAFSVAGSGTVLTGTVFNGALEVGDSVLVSPSGEPARVRGIQVHGKPATRVVAGERCALNLARTKLDDVKRGDWVLAPQLHRPTRRIDVRLKLVAGDDQPLKHWTPVHVHLGTSDVLARVAIRRGASVAPGESALVQLVLDSPIGALRGDRIILRDQSASRTLGGGVVLDPVSVTTRRGAATRLLELAAFEHDAPEQALAALLAARQSVDMERFEAAYNLRPEFARRLVDSLPLALIGADARVAITRERLAALRARALTELAQFHQLQPRAQGMDLDALRETLAPDLDADAFATVLQALVADKKLDISGATVRACGHVATANDADELLWQRVRPAIEAGGYLAPSVPELAEQLKLREAVIKDFLQRKHRSGEVLKVTADRYFLRATLAGLAAAARELARAQPDGRFTAAQYRDATGIGRNHTIELLEFFDVLGILRRFGNARAYNKDYLPILGEGTPPPRPSARPVQAAPAPSGGYRR